MGLLQQRRDEGAICSVCRSPDYTRVVGLPEGQKPAFKCGQCGHIWCYGKDGGIYTKFLHVGNKKK